MAHIAYNLGLLLPYQCKLNCLLSMRCPCITWEMNSKHWYQSSNTKLYLSHALLLSILRLDFKIFNPLLVLWPSGRHFPCDVMPTIFLIGIVGGGVQLGPLGTATTNRPIVPAQGDYDDGEIGGMICRGNRSTRRKPALLPRSPPQTPTGCPDVNPGRCGGKPATNRLS
jgi:hypothetical protein